MLALEIIAERKIEEALARGEFDNLPGAGRPLDLDDVDPLIPEELRMAFRILKNAGFEAAQEAEQELAERTHARRKLSVLGVRIESAYYEKVLARLT
jgi:hypothetical protein